MSPKDPINTNILQKHHIVPNNKIITNKNEFKQIKKFLKEERMHMLGGIKLNVIPLNQSDQLLHSQARRMEGRNLQ